MSPTLAIMALLTSAISTALIVVGCSGSKIGDVLGTVQKFETVAKTGQQAIGNFQESQRELSAEDEYNYGTAALAGVFGSSGLRPVTNRPDLTAYVDQVGQTLAMVCNEPDQFQGWHFGVADSNEVNAFSAPGGMVVVTTGLLRACADEDELAAVLAHEVAHIEGRHPVKTLKQAQREASFTGAGKAVNQAVGDARFSQIVSVSLEKVGESMRNGYSKELEQVADKRAVDLMAKAGYNPDALVRFLSRLAPGPSGGLLERTGLIPKTHGNPADRARAVAELVQAYRAAGWSFADNPARQARFRQTVRF